MEKKIEVLGTGCPKCQMLTKHAEEAVRELGFEGSVEKVTDIVEIASRGVMMTPALSIDGDVKVVGKVPTVEEIKLLLQ
jgi:small redox-active disulfide protein 2